MTPPFDLTATLRALILGLPTVAAVAGTRIFIAAELPAGYDPKAVATSPALTGPAVLFSDRGGRPNVTSVLLDSTYQARCYAADQQTARDLDARLLAALHDRARGRIRVIRCTTTGQHVSDYPQTGWHLYLSTWQVTAVIA
ncbi:MAG: hypothetical protein WCI67_06210 [Chloroflexales bacterium]